MNFLKPNRNNVLIRYLKIGLIILLISLLAFSCFYIASSLDLIGKLKKLDAENVYFVMSKYSGLYKVTFIVLAVFLTIKQLKLNQESNDRALAQMKLTEEDIVDKKQREIKSDTQTV